MDHIYTIDRRLVEGIRAGRVYQTFEVARSQRVQPGQRMRLIAERGGDLIIPDPTCMGVTPCEIGWTGEHITRIRQGGIPLIHLERFAWACGYEDVQEMEEAYSRRFRPASVAGFVIEWRPPLPMEMAVA